MLHRCPNTGRDVHGPSYPRAELSGNLSGSSLAFGSFDPGRFALRVGHLDFKWGRGVFVLPFLIYNCTF